MKRGDILVIYRKQLGDLVLLQPALEHLAERGRRAVRVSTRPAFADLLSLMPGEVSLAEQPLGPIAEVVCFDDKFSTLWDAVRVFPARRKLILTRPERKWWFGLFFSQIDHVTGNTEYRGSLFYRAVGGRDFAPPRLHRPPAEWLPPGLPESFLVVHPTSAWRRKTWPVESWVEMLSRLAPGLGCKILLTAGPEDWEQEMAAAIAEALPQHALLAGRTSLRAYLAILAKAQAVLTVDGSASHLAAAFGRRVLTLFGPTSHIHWHCPTARSRSLAAVDYVSERKPPVSAIPVDEVLAMAQRLLQETVDG